MKITVEKTDDVHMALDLLCAFIRQKAEGFPCMRTPMSVYISLADGSGVSCGGNAREYRIHEDGSVVDVTVEREDRLKGLALQGLMCEVERLLRVPQENAAKIANAAANYQDAVTRGYTTAERWKRRIKQWEKEKAEAEANRAALLEIREKAKTGGKIRWYTRKNPGKDVRAGEELLICGLVRAAGRQYLFGDTLKEVPYGYRLCDDDFAAIQG